MRIGNKKAGFWYKDTGAYLSGVVALCGVNRYKNKDRRSEMTIMSKKLPTKAGLVWAVILYTENGTIRGSKPNNHSFV